MPFALSILAATFTPTAFGGGEEMTKMWSSFSTLGAVGWVLYIGLVPGFSEEIFFRGFVQRRLLYRRRALHAIGLSSILFGVMHVDPPAIALAVVLGAWLGWIAWRTGSILPTIATHVLVNSAWNAAQIIVRKSQISDSYVWVSCGVLAAVSLVCFVITVRRLSMAPPPALPPYCPPPPAARSS